MQSDVSFAELLPVDLGKLWTPEMFMSPYFVVRVIRDWKNEQQISTIAAIIL